MACPHWLNNLSQDLISQRFNCLPGNSSWGQIISKWAGVGMRWLVYIQYSTNKWLHIEALSFPPYLYKFYQMSVWITQNIIPSFWVSSMFLLCIKLNGNYIMSFKSLGQYIFVHIKINEIYNDLTRDDCIHTFQETHCSRLHSHSHLSSMSYLMCGMKTGALQPGTYGLNTQVSPVALCAYMCQPQLLSCSEGRWALGKIAQ